MPTLPAASAHGRKHCIVPLWGALIGTAGHLRGGPGCQTAEVSPCDAVPSRAKGSWGPAEMGLRQETLLTRASVSPSITRMVVMLRFPEFQVWEQREQTLFKPLPHIVGFV